MRPRRPIRAGVAALVVAASVGTAAVTVSAKPPPTGGGGGTRIFELSGSVEDLWPGSREPLLVKIENPYRFTTGVDSLDVDVASASSTCPASVLSVEPLAGEVRIRANREATVELRVNLDADAPDACQGATWQLTYRATARRLT